MTYVRKNVLITAKTYPVESRKHHESVCTAGIDLDTGEWIRLYPIPFEIFRGPQRFSKYHVIEVQCKNSSATEKLRRRESHKVLPGSIKVVDTSLSEGKVDWDARKELVLPLVNQSIEELRELYNENKTSLGLVKPSEVIDFYLKNKEELEDEEKKLVSNIQYAQMTIEGKVRKPLQQFSEVLKYRFNCSDERCTEHNILCEDWELWESWRRWRDNYPDPNVHWEKIYQKYFTEMVNQKDLYFYMGTHSLYPQWLIIGLFYPPRTVQAWGDLKPQMA